MEGSALPKPERKEMKTLPVEQLSPFSQKATSSDVFEMDDMELAAGLWHFRTERTPGRCMGCRDTSRQVTPCPPVPLLPQQPRRWGKNHEKSSGGCPLTPEKGRKAGGSNTAAGHVFWPAWVTALVECIFPRIL